MAVFAFCFTVSMLLTSIQCVSTKLDFGEDQESGSIVSNSSTSDDDVEVKHTIVVSTKLKNNNRRGLHSNDADPGMLTYNIGRNGNQEDSSEVPILIGNKAVETTQIRTPDSRYKTRIYPDSVFINRNIRDQYDFNPNIALNPSPQWRPSNFFKNVNYWNQDSNSLSRPRNDISGRGTVNFHRKITDDGMKEFYCRRCRELSQGSRNCGQERKSSWIYETTTPKIKIDGKLAKLN